MATPVLLPFPFILLRTPLQGLQNAYKPSKETSGTFKVPSVTFKSPPATFKISAGTFKSPSDIFKSPAGTFKDTSILFEEGLYLSSPEFWQELQKAGLQKDAEKPEQGDAKPEQGDKKLEQRDAKLEQENEKLERSFMKFWLRSCTRCTPYGTFAGSVLVNVSDKETSLVLADSQQHLRRTRIDMNYLANLVAAATKIPAILEQVKFYPNNSLYELPDSFRYAEYTISNNTRYYRLTSVEKTSAITAALEAAKQGATIEELVSRIMELDKTTRKEKIAEKEEVIEEEVTKEEKVIREIKTPEEEIPKEEKVIGEIKAPEEKKVVREIEAPEEEEVTEEEARAFIISIWEAQLLLSELEPCVTGKEPLDRLIEQLSSFKGIGYLMERLREIQYLLLHPGEGVEYYKAIEKKLRELDLPLEIPKSTLQTDLFLSTSSNSINNSLIREIVNQVSALTALSRRNTNAGLESFKAKFQARYEDAEIPLNLALDADLGIGYAGVNADAAGKGELIENLAIGIPAIQSGGEFDYIVQYTLAKYHDFLQNNKPFIEITAEELKGYKGRVEKFRFPDSMFIMGDLMKKDGRLDTANFIFDLSAFGGPSGGNLLGRFAHGDPQIYSATREILKQEELEYPDAIYAEIVHLPQARIGNILLRPLFRNYEIPYVGKSGMAPENQIPVEDLVISIQNNEIILRSRKLNKRVIPRLTTAHNFAFDSLPVYKFLCDLQGQGISYPNVWDWGHLEMLKHLPRVVYKNIILRKARWNVEEKDIRDLPAQVKDEPARTKAPQDQPKDRPADAKDRPAQPKDPQLQVKDQSAQPKDLPDQPKDPQAQASGYKAWFGDFCKKWNIPSRVVYRENDNKLLIDFNEETGIRLFLHYLKRYKKIVIEEFLFNEDNCVVSDVNGMAYTNEIIIPVYQKHDNDKQQAAPLPKENADLPVKDTNIPNIDIPNTDIPNIETPNTETPDTGFSIKSADSSQKNTDSSEKNTDSSEKNMDSSQKDTGSSDEKNTDSPVKMVSAAIKRKFSPHSEWLYFKVYCGPKTAEKILKDIVLPFVEKATQDKIAERFFFVRYRDEFPHLRIRFYNSVIDKQLPLQAAFMRVLQPFLDNGMIHSVIIDTYSRELERYGEDLIEEAERLFHNDSLAILRFINLLEEEDEKYRILFALRGIDMLLGDFNLDTPEKLELAKRIQQSYFKEFGSHPDLQKQLNAKYRQYQQMIFSHMDRTQDTRNEIEDAASIFRLRSEMNKPVTASILSKLPPHNSRESLSGLLPNYIHMFMNRLFIAQQRKYELVIYHFLEKYYTSQAAIEMKKNPK